MRIRNAGIAGMWLLAAACGSDASDTSTATRANSRSNGGEVAVRATMDAPESARPGADDEGRDRELVLGPSGAAIGGVQDPTPATDREMTAAGIGDRGAVDGATAPGDRAGVTADDRGMDARVASEGAPEAQGGPATATTEDVCPADVDGLEVRVASIPRGGALVMTAARDEVELLRERLRRFVDLHTERRTSVEITADATAQALGIEPRGTATGFEAMPGAGPGVEPAEGRAFADEAALVHTAERISLVEIPRGARLEIVLGDADHVRALRTELREDADMLRRGLCPLALQVETAS